MSLTSYRAAQPRVGGCVVCVWCGAVCGVCRGAGGPGGDLLSRVLGHSTMGAGGFHGRVRDGIGCGPPAKATRSSSPSVIWLNAGSGDLLLASGSARELALGPDPEGVLLLEPSPRTVLRMISMHGGSRALSGD